MNSHASYIYSAYSFIHSLDEEKLSQVGNLYAEGNLIPSFDEDLLISLCQDVISIIKNEKSNMEIEGDVIVVGDIHGSLHDLLRIIRFIETTDSKVIFLGDYVDRGCFSLECITLLFALKVLKPNSFYLLRGNHEFNEMSCHYGFKQEILNYHNPYKNISISSEQSKPKIADESYINFDIDDKEKNPSSVPEDSYYADHTNINCYKYTEKLYDSFLKAFSYLPISAIVNKTSLCLHGGLTPLLTSVENINEQIKRPILDFDENPLLSDIIWGDPCPELQQFYNDNQRGRGKLFNGPVVVNFLKNNNLKRLIRGHECVTNGIEELFNRKCITVFSASSYSGDMSNSSGILMIYENEDKIRPIIFPPLHRLKKCDTNYYKVQAFIQKGASLTTLPKLSTFKSGFILSFNHLASSSTDSISFHYHTARKNSSRESTDYENNCEQKVMKIPKLLPKPRKRLSCVSKAPIVLTPQVTKNLSQEL